MITIPAPWLVSIFATLIAALVGVQTRLPTSAKVFFCAGLFSVAIVMGVLGVRVPNDHAVLAGVQPHLAIAAPLFLWLGFRSLTTQERWPGRRLLWASGAVFVAAQGAILLPVPWSADIVVTLVYAAYVALTAMMLRLDADAFVQSAPENHHSIRIALAACAAFCALVLISDASIIAATLSAGDAGVMNALSGASGVVVVAVLVGAIVGIPLVLRRRGGAEAPSPPPSGDDRDLLVRLETLMRESQIYKDPDLSLARLGRRLGVPARSVSAAVNRATGENVSRYVNAFRARHAAQLLESTDLPVTDVMLESGFTSKSSFNAEFRRVLGTTPSGHRKGPRV